MAAGGRQKTRARRCWACRGPAAAEWEADGLVVQGLVAADWAAAGCRPAAPAVGGSAAVGLAVADWAAAGLPKAVAC